MKICVLTTTYPRYQGDPVGSFIVGQARDLALQGHKVHVIAPHDPRAGSPNDETEGNLNTHRFHYWWPQTWQRLCYGAGIAENVRRNRLLALQFPTLISAMFWRALPFIQECDVVHGHWSFAGLAALIGGGLTGKPVVMTMHGPKINARAVRGLDQFVTRRVDALVVNSQFTKDLARRFVPGVPATVIPFGVNSEKIAPSDFDRVAFRREAGIPTDAMLVLGLGRMIEFKGFSTLIDSAALLPTKPRLVVAIGGDGPLRGTLQSQIERLGLAERVRLLGALHDPEPARWFAAADVFVLPSIEDSQGDTEGLGVVLLEAMANGIAVVASRIGGITDIVHHEQTGLLAKAGDPADLAAQIERLLSDSVLRANLIKNARSLIDDQFSWKAVNQSLLSVYQAAIDSGMKRRAPKA